MKTIAVCSFKGGTAKTSVCLNIGGALATLHKKKVLLVDFDAQANLTAGLGFDPDSHDSLSTVLQGEKGVDQVILPTCYENLSLIPADTWLERIEVTGALAGDRYSHEKLRKTLTPLSHDIAIIDTPPSLCWLTESALIAADSALVCIAPEFYSIKGLQRLSYFIEYIAKRHPLNVCGVVVSFWNPRGKNNESFLSIVEEAFPGKVLQTKIRRDIAISEAAIHGKPVFHLKPKSRAAEDYQGVTKELVSLFKEQEQKAELSLLC